MAALIRPRAETDLAACVGALRATQVALGRDDGIAGTATVPSLAIMRLFVDYLLDPP